MKLLCCFALFLAGHAQAGELLPVTGDDAEHVQRALDQFLLPVVTAVDGITVEPVIEEMRLAGRAKRIFLGPLARNSFITLRVKITDSGKVTEETFSDESSAWKGSLRPGEDYDMLDRVAERAAQFVNNYQLLRQPRVQPLSDVVGQKQTTDSANADNKRMIIGGEPERSHREPKQK